METIARREVKYLVPIHALSRLRADLVSLLRPDPLGGPGGYAVRSLYFETFGLHTLREKLAGLYDRYKLRVRGYPDHGLEDPLILEIKRKQGDWIHKERTRLTQIDLADLLACRYSPLLERSPEDAVLRRFVGAKAALGAVAPLIVDYQREAFVHPCPGVYQRATLDTRFRVAADGRFFRAEPPPFVFGFGYGILEIKTTGPAPGWLPFLQNRHPLDPRALSKFAHACQRTYSAPAPT